MPRILEGASYYDGHSAKPSAVRLQVLEGSLLIEGEGVSRRVPLEEIDWPERRSAGPRVAHLPRGGSVQSMDAAQWDAWAAASGWTDSAVVRAQLSWRATLFALVALVAVLAAGYVWGLPWLSAKVVDQVPTAVDDRIGETLHDMLIERELLEESRIDPGRQRALAESFRRYVSRTYGDQAVPRYTLAFHASPLGPNALALPDGTIVVTDALVELLKDGEPTLMGVMGHELGHVEGRHGMRQLVQASILGGAGALVFGDFSHLFATAPALLGQLSYSRTLELEADDAASRLLLANGQSPQVMAVLFERLAGARASSGKADDDSALGIALTTHPADAERIRRFREADRRGVSPAGR